MIYSFTTKTTYDPNTGLSIRAFNSKSDYLRVAPLKLVSMAACEPDNPVLMRTLLGDQGAKDLVNSVNALIKPDDILVSHTDFHQAALEIRSGMKLTHPVVLIDELARKSNPMLKSVSLDKLHALYGPHNLQRPKLDLAEGQHGLLDLQCLNEVDTLIVMHVYLKLAGELKAAEAKAN